MQPGLGAIIGIAAAGLLVGQLLNLLANGLSFPQRPRLSACSRCGRRAGLVDLIPVVAWLGGTPHCRTCGNPRPFREPVVAVAFTAIALVAAVRLGLSVELWHALIALTLISLVAITDAVYWVMPFE